MTAVECEETIELVSEPGPVITHVCPGCDDGIDPTTGARCSSCDGTGQTARDICFVCGRPKGHILERGHCAIKEGGVLYLRHMKNVVCNG